MAFTLGRFRGFCDIDDRLRLGLPVDPIFTRFSRQGGWGVSQMMDPIRRADLELRFSFIEPSLRRELNTPGYASLGSTLPGMFGYQPVAPPYGSGPNFLRGLMP